MTFPDIGPDLKARMPQLRGRLLANQSLAELTWFRVGGPAQVLFVPEDEADLAYVLPLLPSDLPVTVVGLGSNLIVRDGGVPGLAIRLGRGPSDDLIGPKSIGLATGMCIACGLGWWLSRTFRSEPHRFDKPDLLRSGS